MPLARVVPAALAALLAVPGPVRADDPCPAGMVRFSPGAFRAEDGRDAAVPAFCLDVTEVTVGAWAACVAAGACSAERLACGSAATWGREGGEALPINCVDWNEADAFCRAHGKRLPTEDEWEWAARGGARARIFAWGAEPPADRACWDGEGNSEGKGRRFSPCPVGAHPAARSADGLDDLGGNVREWTSTAEGRFRVLRGGSWGDSLPEFLSAGFRGWNAPDERFELTGLRCAAEPDARQATLR
jgi:formylglycine-generating enzyme required for sulfatase activity